MTENDAPEASNEMVFTVILSGLALVGLSVAFASLMSDPVGTFNNGALFISTAFFLIFLFITLAYIKKHWVVIKKDWDDAGKWMDRPPGGPGFRR